MPRPLGLTRVRGAIAPCTMSLLPDSSCRFREGQGVRGASPSKSYCAERYSRVSRICVACAKRIFMLNADPFALETVR